MASSIEDKILVDFGSITVGKVALSGTMKFDIKDKNPRKHVGDIWAELANRRLNGRLYMGGEATSQRTIKGEKRVVLEGSFDTNRPTFNDDHVSLSMTFNKKEVDEDVMTKFSHKQAWIEIDDIIDIPKKPKAGSRSVFEVRPIADLGISDPVEKKILAGDVKSIGDLIDVVLEKSETTVKDLKLTASQLAKVEEKIEFFYEDNDLVNPLEKVEG